MADARVLGIAAGLRLRDAVDEQSYRWALFPEEKALVQRWFRRLHLPGGGTCAEFDALSDRVRAVINDVDRVLDAALVAAAKEGKR